MAPIFTGEPPAIIVPAPRQLVKPAAIIVARDQPIVAVGPGMMAPPMVAAVGGGGAPGPDSVTGLWSWQVADAGTFQTSGGSAATSDTDPVGEWQDQSGNGRHFSQATAGLRPILKLSILNSLPVLRFDGTATGDSLSLPDMSGLTEAEWYVVIQLTADPGIGGSAWLTGTSGEDSHYPYSDGVIYDGWGTTVRKTVGNPTPSLASWRLYNTATKSGEWTARLDGTQIFTTGTNTVGFSAAPRFGRGGTGTGVFADVAEIIIYDHLQSGPDRAVVNEYIADRYALTIA